MHFSGTLSSIEVNRFESWRVPVKFVHCLVRSLVSSSFLCINERQLIPIYLFIIQFYILFGSHWNLYLIIWLITFVPLLQFRCFTIREHSKCSLLVIVLWLCFTAWKKKYVTTWIIIVYRFWKLFNQLLYELFRN